MLHKLRFVVVWLCVLSLSACLNPGAIQAPGAMDLRTQVGDAIARLNPLVLALDPLIDEAIGKGNDALRDRLEQLRGILQGVIAQLNAVAKARIDQADNAAKNRINQMLRAADQLIELTNGLVRGDIELASKRASQVLIQGQVLFGNVVAAATPFAFEPLPYAGLNGIHFVKSRRANTEVFIPGVGLFRRNKVPGAWLIRSGGSSRAVKLAVVAHSMGLIELSIPNKLLSDDPEPSRHTLKLRLERGGFFHSFSEPTLPLYSCGLREGLALRATLTASGQVRQVKVIRHPLSNQPPNAGGEDFYYDSTKGNGHTNAPAICAVAEPGWQVDTSRNGADVEGKWHHGLSVMDSSDSRTGSNNRWVGDCFQLYCAGDCHVAAYGVHVAEMRFVSTPLCSKQPVVTQLPLRYGLQQQQLDIKAALGACVPGLSKEPEYRVRLQVVASPGKVLETRDLALGGRTTALNGTVVFNLDSSGLLDTRVSSACDGAFPTGG